MVLDSAHSLPKQKPERSSEALSSRLCTHGTESLLEKSALVKNEKTIDGVPPLACFYHLPSDELSFACPWVLSDSIAQKASLWQPIGEPDWLPAAAASLFSLWLRIGQLTISKIRQVFVAQVTRCTENSASCTGFCAVSIHQCEVVFSLPDPYPINMTLLFLFVRANSLSGMIFEIK
jgi:hypothetical protein